jgi:hypothetical protein
MDQWDWNFVLRGSPVVEKLLRAGPCPFTSRFLRSRVCFFSLLDWITVLAKHQSRQARLLLREYAPRGVVTRDSMPRIVKTTGWRLDGVQWGVASLRNCGSFGLSFPFYCQGVIGFRTTSAFNKSTTDKSTSPDDARSPDRTLEFINLLGETKSMDIEAADSNLLYIFYIFSHPCCAFGRE